jgi:hypothetical protein
MTVAMPDLLEYERPISKEKLSTEHITHLGRIAIRAEQLGINDSLSHLYQYLEKGEAAMPGIIEDLETNVAERLPKTPFYNYVNFEFTGNDFISVKDKISMKVMTANNKKLLAAESANNPSIISEYARAKVESEEVDKLVDWYLNAPKDSCIIFESLPIGNQTIAVSRIYTKAEGGLQACFVSLYNPSIEQFNTFRRRLNADVPDSLSELEMLKNHYQLLSPNLHSFIDYYVGTYDDLMHKKTGNKHSFGLEKKDDQETQNGLEKVRAQTKLTSIYPTMIKALHDGQGKATSKLIGLKDKLGINIHLYNGQTISINLARELLDETIYRITSVIDKADAKLLVDLENNSDQSAGYSAASFFGNQAKESGKTYASNACPESTTSNQDTPANSAENEYDILMRAFNGNNLPDNFGQPQIKACRTNNCPSRGRISWWPDKTLVGGCGFCVCCHHHLAAGKSPEHIYSQEEKEKIYNENVDSKSVRGSLLFRIASRLIGIESAKEQHSENSKQKHLQTLPVNNARVRNTAFENLA